MTPKPRAIMGFEHVTGKGWMARLSCGHRVQPRDTGHVRQRGWRCEQPEYATRGARDRRLAMLDAARKRIGVEP